MLLAEADRGLIEKSFLQEDFTEEPNESKEAIEKLIKVSTPFGKSFLKKVTEISDTNKKSKGYCSDPKKPTKY